MLSRTRQTNPAKNSHHTKLAALAKLLAVLAQHHYRFCTTTPTTHARLALKRELGSADLRDIFGWNLRCPLAALPHELAQLMQEAGILRSVNGMASSTMRVASLGADLFLHSAFPTLEPEAVFFGPDTYRFARFITGALNNEDSQVRFSKATSLRPIRILDIGCGSGAGGIVAGRAILAKSLPVELILSDINPTALSLAATNARAAGIEASCILSDTFSAVTGNFDVIVSNPPYLQDDTERLYRHGGERLGRALSVRIATESLTRLNDQGLLLLYTGVAMVDACDPFLDELTAPLNTSHCIWSYEEIDPDVFAEELDRPIYQAAHRIAAVALMARFEADSDYAR